MATGYAALLAVLVAYGMRFEKQSSCTGKMTFLNGLKLSLSGKGST